MLPAMLYKIYTTFSAILKQSKHMKNPAYSISNYYYAIFNI